MLKTGETLIRIERVGEAIQDYLRAIAVGPTAAEAHANLVLGK